jgi:AraC family ethanolamine operon transcriptional activator
MPTVRIIDRFRDIADLGRQFGWDLGFRQLDAGEHSIPAQVVVGEHLTFVSMRFNRTFHQLGIPPSGMVTFGVPIVGMRDWFGRTCRDSSILPFNHPGGIDGVSEQGFEAFTISICEEFLHELSGNYQIPVPDFIITPRTDTIIGDSWSTRDFRAAASRIINDKRKQLDQESENELAFTLLSAAISGLRTVDKSMLVTRSRATQKALEYINDSREDVVTVRDICEKCGIASRTLNRAFRERFGIGPKSYLKHQRLSATRSELIASPPETLIADVANRWGFWHIGQFAKDYKALFDELPSETLKAEVFPRGPILGGQCRTR